MYVSDSVIKKQSRFQLLISRLSGRYVVLAPNYLSLWQASWSSVFSVRFPFVMYSPLNTKILHLVCTHDAHWNPTVKGLLEPVRLQKRTGGHHSYSFRALVWLPWRPREYWAGALSQRCRLKLVGWKQWVRLGRPLVRWRGRKKSCQPECFP